MNGLNAQWENKTLTRLNKGLPVFGISVRGFRSGDIAHIAKTSGHHFLFVDTQHSIFDRETLYQIAQIASPNGISPLVRLKGIDDSDAALLLDNGYQGVIYPDINTAEEAQHAVATCKFSPLGMRSVAGGYPMFNFKAGPLSETTKQLNQQTLLGVMIETEEGLSNVEAIAAVPGIDVIHVGTNDLLTNMGITGEFDHPKIIEAQGRVIQACQKNGIYSGCGGNRDLARQASFIQKGVQFVTTQTDIAFTISSSSQWINDLNQKLGS
ncbi:aldolase/citrate lyase family protein [Litorivicinus sp.]|nr:aldolase/citrate lyase family protein [Litorivicinus sp.]MDC1240517.1 aldolase/citrate lyase family protein [Litorivicinus sp.]